MNIYKDCCAQNNNKKISNGYIDYKAHSDSKNQRNIYKNCYAKNNKKKIQVIILITKYIQIVKSSIIR